MINTLELFIQDTVYTILLNCVEAGTNKKAVLTNKTFLTGQLQVRFWIC